MVTLESPRYFFGQILDLDTQNTQDCIFNANEPGLFLNKNQLDELKKLEQFTLALFYYKIRYFGTQKHPVMYYEEYYWSSALNGFYFHGL